MIVYHFIIVGNQENLVGNAVPYFRRTQNGWNKGVTRYNEWKDYVRHCFYQQEIFEQVPQLRRPIDEKPIVLLPMQEARMNIVIQWASEAHADPDNIFKGIADALFENDKHLTGTIEAHHSKGQPQVQVSITVFDAPAQVDAPGKKKEKKAVNQAVK